MTIQGVFRSDLRVTSKSTAMEFYKGVKSVILIPFSKTFSIRVEPGNLFSLVSVASVRNGAAVWEPSLHDADGSLAFQHRKYINAYLSNIC